MTYELIKTRVWDRATPNDGDLLEAEFNRTYNNFRHLKQQDFTFEGTISILESLDVKNGIRGIEPWKLIFHGDVKELAIDDRGLFKVILRHRCTCSETSCYRYITVDCGLYHAFSPGRHTNYNLVLPEVRHWEEKLLPTSSSLLESQLGRQDEISLICEAKNNGYCIRVIPADSDWKIHLVYKVNDRLNIPDQDFQI